MTIRVYGPIHNESRSITSRFTYEEILESETVTMGFLNQYYIKTL